MVQEWAEKIVRNRHQTSVADLEKKLAGPFKFLFSPTHLRNEIFGDEEEGGSGNDDY